MGSARSTIKGALQGLRRGVCSSISDINQKRALDEAGTTLPSARRTRKAEAYTYEDTAKRLTDAKTHRLKN